MLRKKTTLGGCLLLSLFAFVACGGGGEEAQDRAREQQRQEEWSWLQETKEDLDARRARLAEVRGELAAAEAGDTELGEEEVAALEQEARELAEGIEADTAAFVERLIAFINEAAIEVGQELPERVKAAIRMKSDEDMLVAREYIEKGGDYRRALDIYQAALQVDPENDKLKAAIEEAEAMRWMDEERFAQVEKGMTQDEVKEVLGQPNLRNIQEYPDKNAVAWFYPKGPDRSAAGVYFQKKGDGPYKVYLADFDAVEPSGPGAGGQGADSAGS